MGADGFPARFPLAFTPELAGQGVAVIDFPADEKVGRQHSGFRSQTSLQQLVTHHVWRRREMVVTLPTRQMAIRPS